LNQKGLWNYPRFPITNQAIYKRLEKDGSKPFEKLFEMVSIALRDRLKGYARPLVKFTDEIVAIDATSLDKVSRHLPLLRYLPNGDERLFPGNLSGVFDIVLQHSLPLLLRKVGKVVLFDLPDAYASKLPRLICRNM
jgi:hypothetical protein